MIKNESNIFNNNFCFSKVLKDIDFRIKFKNYKEEKSLYILKQLQKEQKEKKILMNKRKNHNEIVHSLKKANEEKELLLNYKNNLLNKNISQIKSYSSRNNYFPKLSKKDEEKNNDNKIIIFEKIWKEQYLNKTKRNKGRRNNSNKAIYNNNYGIDIFDESYDKVNKKKEKKTQKKILLDKIKNNNLKVVKKLKIHKDLLSKFKDKREYIPNYNAIEKHQPRVNLNTKSQRIFPVQFIKIYNIGELSSQEKRSESNYKTIIKKNNSNQSLFLNNLSTCTLFKNYLNNNKDNSLNKGIEHKNRSMIIK